MKRIRFTEAELLAVLNALGNTTHYGDAMFSVFSDDERAVKACYRGQAKLEEMLHRIVRRRLARE